MMRTAVAGTALLTIATVALASPQIAKPTKRGRGDREKASSRGTRTTVVRR